MKSVSFRQLLRSHIWLLGGSLVVFFLAVAIAILVAIELYVPFRPTAIEVITYYSHQPVRWDPHLKVPAPTAPIVLRVEPLGPWQAVLARHEQTDGRTCLGIDLVTKRLLMGIQVQGGSGNCFDLMGRTDPIELVSVYRDLYVVQAGLVIDPAIAGLQLNWADGTQSTLAVDETFLTTRQDGVRLVSLLGLDAHAAVVEGSLVRDRSLQLENAVATRRVPVASGFVDVGVYDQPTQVDQHCLKLSFMTAQNLARSLTGETYMSEQILCGELLDWRGGLQ